MLLKIGMDPEFRKLPCGCQVVWWTFIVAAIIVIGAVWGYHDGDTEIDAWAGAFALPIWIGLYYGVCWLVQFSLRLMETVGRRLFQTIRR